MKNQITAVALPATYEDLLFMNKNKSYGAYILRKLYKKHMTIACIISIGLFTLSISSPLILNNEKADIRIKNPLRDTTIINLEPPPSIDPEKEILEIPPEYISSINTVRFTVPKIVVNTEDIDDYVPDVQALKDATPWTETQIGQNGGYDITLQEIVEGTQKKEVETEELPPAVNFVEEMPAYPGGDEALLSFFGSNIQYPEIARKAGIEGKVFLEFIVEKDGTISNTRIARGIGGGCDEEAARVLKMLGKWRPGRQNGTPVRVRIIVPVKFMLK